MNPGDLVKWTFSKGFALQSRRYRFGILIKKQEIPVGSWIILLQDGSLMHGDISEIEVLSERRRSCKM